MNCSNCGAALELGENRTFFTCQYCQTVRPMPTEFASQDRVVSLGRTCDENCPHCEIPLEEAVVDGLQAKTCLQCLGVLMEAPIFAEVTRNRRMRYKGPDLPPTRIDPELLSRVIHCPRCRVPMDAHPNYGPGQAVIDSCNCCHLVWLDSSELTSLEQSPGRRN